MIITVGKGADVEAVRRELVGRGLWVERFDSGDRVCFTIGAGSRAIERESLLGIRGVESIAVAKSAHPKVDAQPRIARVGRVELGRGLAPVFIAGPCSVESEEQVRALAEQLARAGVKILRGGAFKPRTSPYAFQGHGAPALTWMRRAANTFGLEVVTELMSEKDAELVAEHADLIQIGSRNMHNSKLLEVAAKQARPILLKRGMAATIEEWLCAGEYCLVHGAPQVIFCERGIRSFDPSTRNLLDLGAVALLAGVLGQPVVVDPSHAVGRRDLIPALAAASIAAGAAGLMIETHVDRGAALSDGAQALLPDDVAAIVARTEVRHA